MTKEEALNDVQELIASMEQMLSYADELLCDAEKAKLKPSMWLIEILHEELIGAVSQIKSSKGHCLDMEMRNYVALTISKARQTMREAEFAF